MSKHRVGTLRQPLEELNQSASSGLAELRATYPTQPPPLLTPSTSTALDAALDQTDKNQPSPSPPTNAERSTNDIISQAHTPTPAALLGYAWQHTTHTTCHRCTIPYLSLAQASRLTTRMGPSSDDGTTHYEDPTPSSCEELSVTRNLIVFTERNRYPFYSMGQPNGILLQTAAKN